MARIAPPAAGCPRADSEENKIRFGNVEVNIETRHVRVDGKEVRFTPTEFELLRYLILNPGVPIPHRKLLNEIWGPDYVQQVEYLHVYINQIRKKIEPDPASPRFVVTEPWVGYRFQMPKAAPVR